MQASWPMGATGWRRGSVNHEGQAGVTAEARQAPASPVIAGKPAHTRGTAPAIRHGIQPVSPPCGALAYPISTADATPVGAGLPAITGKAGAIHRSACITSKGDAAFCRRISDILTLPGRGMAADCAKLTTQDAAAQGTSALLRPPTVMQGERRAAHSCLENRLR